MTAASCHLHYGSSE